MHSFNTLLHGLTFLLASSFFILMSWVSLKFFVVEDPGSRKGKRLVSVAAGGTALMVLWVLGHAPTPPSGGATFTQLFAIALYIYALVMFYWAWRANQKMPLDFIGSSRQPSHLNRNGPYSVVRHPFYSAYCAAWIASAFATQGHALVALMSGILIFVYVHGASREERLFGRGQLGPEYFEYSRSVPMLIPKVKGTRMVD